MNDREARQLAARVPKEAWHQVRVKIGRTNGRPTLHITDTEAKDRSRASTTIYSEGEWLIHPLNHRNKPSKRRENVDLAGIQESFTKVTAAFQALTGQMTTTAVAMAGIAAAVENE